MKKIIPSLFALALAFVFSAFTPASQSDDIYYHNGSSYVPVPPDTFICPESNGPQCLSTVDEVEDVPLYKDQSGTQLRTFN